MTPSAALQARRVETERLDALLRAAASGAGAALVVHGEAGMGKTALVDHALGRTTGLRTLGATGAEFEMELAYAALHQVCAPVLDSRVGLPDPQRAALEAAFGLRSDDAPDPFLVGLAVLGLLSEVSHAEPVACVVDDAQWIDASSMQALAFAARRVESEPIAFLFCQRDPVATPQLAGLSRLAITGLDDADARALLAAEIGVPLDEDVRERIVAEAHGNPLALLVLPRGAGQLELAGGFGTLASRTVAGVIEDGFTRQLADLSAAARALLVLAAAEPLGDPELLRRSAEHLGVDPAEAQVLEAADLVVLGPRIRFRHPLARSAAYRSATQAERRRAHAALAQATDPELDADRRAWHAAQATVEPDEGVAADLASSAARALTRGGLAAAAAFLDRAARLTPQAEVRAARTLQAARTTLLAGAPDAALELLERAQAGGLGPGEQAELRLLRALIAFQVRRDAAATGWLLEAAGGLETDAARDTYLEAYSSSMFIDRLPGRLQELATAIKAGAPAREPPRPVDRLLDALTDQMTLPAVTAVPEMRRTMTAFRDDSSGDPRRLDLVAQMAIDLHDDAAVRELADRQVHLARRRGELSILPMALNVQILADVLTGRLAEASSGVTEAYAVVAATGSAGLVFGDVVLGAWRGDEARVDAVFAAMHAGHGRIEVVAELYARAVLYNGLGRYEAALDAGLRAVEQERAGSYVVWQTGPELVEAAVRAGRPEAAAGALERIIERARASATNWAIGSELQARALLADDSDADALYVEAIDRLGRSRARPFHARAQLVYGEWLRRRQRRVEARTQLRSAHSALSAMGADGFAERAARELAATGEKPRRREVDLVDALTAQEVHIARHVASGATSKEVAGELFLSPRTVDAHLRSIFRKLGVSSRRELRGLKL